MRLLHIIAIYLFMATAFIYYRVGEVDHAAFMVAGAAFIYSSYINFKVTHGNNKY